ncbi:MAG: hypothetical protein AAGI13_05870 [Pseudomonadota bacterium]
MAGRVWHVLDMPLQTRVLPTGEITAQGWRGSMMGNRGCLHGPDRRLGRSRWRHQNWVCCLTAFRGRWREAMPMRPARTIYTALFFWDEASAFAAGHRPCGECRRADYLRFRHAWREAGLPGETPSEIDRHLHRHRVARDRSQIRHEAEIETLPFGAFILLDQSPAAWTGDRALLWSPEGYRDAGATPARVTVLTPKPVLNLFTAGYRPSLRLHESK